MSNRLALSTAVSIIGLDDLRRTLTTGWTKIQHVACNFIVRLGFRDNGPLERAKTKSHDLHPTFGTILFLVSVNLFGLDVARIL